MPNNSHSSAVPAGTPAASLSPDLGCQAEAMAGVNSKSSSNWLFLVFGSHTVPHLQNFQPEEPLLVPKQGLTVSH